MLSGNTQHHGVTQKQPGKYAYENHSPQTAPAAVTLSVWIPSPPAPCLASLAHPLSFAALLSYVLPTSALVPAVCEGEQAAGCNNNDPRDTVEGRHCLLQVHQSAQLSSSVT